jgi:hypothetical protein
MEKKEEIIAKKEAQERAFKIASDKGDIYFPFAIVEKELERLKRKLKFLEIRERAEWWDFMIPKKDFLILLDEIGS